jgi:hypothetical protein
MEPWTIITTEKAKGAGRDKGKELTRLLKISLERVRGKSMSMKVPNDNVVNCNGLD